MLITSLDAFKILDQIRDMKQNPIAKQLYEAIEGWNENIEIKNNKVINMLITIINNVKENIFLIILILFFHIIIFCTIII